MPQFLSVNEFVAATCLSRPTVTRKIQDKEIPCTRIGRKILIPASYLKELEEKAKASTTKEEA
jgi:excisionase family DNA binding protein